MYTRQITSEQTYTLAEARRIINAEREQKKEMLISRATQKLLGLIAISVSAAELILANLSFIDEGGISIFMLPLGIWLLFTKKNIL